MEKSVSKRSPLAEVEREVLAEGQEWTRKRLEKRLQELADKEGKLSPPKSARDCPGEAVQDWLEDLRRMD
jgi:hypothetical protein